jgi:hypothetical protein
MHMEQQQQKGEEEEGEEEGKKREEGEEGAIIHICKLSGFLRYRGNEDAPCKDEIFLLTLIFPPPALFRPLFLSRLCTHRIRRTRKKGR